MPSTANSRSRGWSSGQPASLQQQVDEVVAGLGLGVVVRVRLRSSFSPCARGDLGAQALQLLVERALSASSFGQLLVALAQRGLHALQLRRGLLAATSSRRLQRAGIEGQPAAGVPAARIGARQPEADMEQLAHRRQRVGRRDSAVAVHGAVAESLTISPPC